MTRKKKDAAPEMARLLEEAGELVINGRLVKAPLPVPVKATKKDGEGNG